MLNFGRDTFMYKFMQVRAPMNKIVLSQNCVLIMYLIILKSGFNTILQFRQQLKPQMQYGFHEVL